MNKLEWNEIVSAEQLEALPDGAYVFLDALGETKEWKKDSAYGTMWFQFGYEVESSTDKIKRWHTHYRPLAPVYPWIKVADNLDLELAAGLYMFHHDWYEQTQSFSWRGKFTVRELRFWDRQDCNGEYSDDAAWTHIRLIERAGDVPLPEVESAIDEIIGIMQLPDGKTGDQVIREMRDNES